MTSNSVANPCFSLHAVYFPARRASQPLLCNHLKTYIRCVTILGVGHMLSNLI